MIIPYSFIAISFASILIGCIVLKERPHRAANQAFLLFCFGIALWIGGFGLLLLTGLQVYIAVLNSGGLLLVFGLSRFAVTFPTPSPLPIRASLFWSPLIIGGGAMLISGTIVTRVEVLPGFFTRVTHGPLICAWSLLLLSYIVTSILFFARSYRFASPEDRLRLRHVYLGIGIFALCAITFDSILPGLFGDSDLNSIGPLSAFAFLVTTAYAIVRHKFMDTRVIVQRGFIYTCAFLALAGIYVLILSIAERATERATGLLEPFSVAATIAIGMYTIPRLEVYFRKVTDPWFFKERYDYFAILDQLTSIVDESVSLRPMALKSLSVFDTAFRPSYSYFVQSSANHYYSCRDLSLLELGSVAATDRELRMPMCAGSRMIGEYVFGSKRSGERYSGEDRSLVRTFCVHAQAAFEKAELYQQLQEYSTSLEAKVEERTRSIHALQVRERELFDNLSHALQTPLTVLKSSVELMRGEPSKKPFRFHAGIEACIDDLSRLVRSMLRIARVESEPIIDVFAEVPLSPLILKVHEYASVMATANGIEMTVTVEPGLLVRGDANQLEEAIANVLGNAVKYTAGCSTRMIAFSAGSVGRYACIEVADTGIGMSEEDQKYAFERFYRARQDNGIRPSTGLGLAIAKRIIERHGGGIVLSSVLGSGTTATITIPLALSEGRHP